MTTAGPMGLVAACMRPAHGGSGEAGRRVWHAASAAQEGPITAAH